ncbi:MAG: Flp pilus assembly protein CpaB [Pseudolabrys sp.]
MKAARVVVLTVAIGAGAVAALLAGRSEKPPEVKPEAVKAETVDVLVARGDIPMGQLLSPGDVQWQEWPATAASGNFIRKNNRPQAIDDLAGQIVRVPFVAGEPIREAKLVNAKGSGFMAAILPTGMRAVSTQISPETSAGGFILPNDHVDVILTRKDREAEKSGSGDAKTSETVLSNVRVLAIDQAVEEKNGQKVVVGKTATLELTPRQAETLVLSQQVGTLSLTLRSITDAQETTAVDPDKSSGKNTVNIIRFGVGTSTTPK